MISWRFSGRFGRMRNSELAFSAKGLRYAATAMALGDRARRASRGRWTVRTREEDRNDRRQVRRTQARDSETARQSRSRRFLGYVLSTVHGRVSQDYRHAEEARRQGFRRPL